MKWVTFNEFDQYNYKLEPVSKKHLFKLYEMLYNKFYIEIGMEEVSLKDTYIRLLYFDVMLLKIKNTNQYVIYIRDSLFDSVLNRQFKFIEKLDHNLITEIEAIFYLIYNQFKYSLEALSPMVDVFLSIPAEDLQQFNNVLDLEVFPTREEIRSIENIKNKYFFNNKEDDLDEDCFLI